MQFHNRFRVKAPLSSVAVFHQQHANMGAITPPPIRVEFRRVPPPLSAGELHFILWFGPLPIHWTASIEDVTESGFTDRQLSGPFSRWVHRHAFIRVDDDTTEVVDQISVGLKPHLLWGPVGLGFLLGLPGLLAYRAWKTRRWLGTGSV